MLMRILAFTLIFLFGTISSRSNDFLNSLMTVERLQEYKITSMDLGIFLLDQELEKFFSETFKLDKYEQYTTNYGTWSRFNDNGKTINIYVNGRDYPALDRSWDFRDECHQVIGALRTILGYVEIDGIRQWEHSLIMQTFQSVYPLDDDDLVGDISNVVYLEFIRKIEGKVYKCSGSLSSDITIIDN